MVETLAQLFLNTVSSYRKPDLMLYKKEGKYVPISTEEFEKKWFIWRLPCINLASGKGIS
ncbi:MAG: hypothetical protein WBI18_05950 [Candidatus Saccharicenans sp.]